jgi:hypothetical protein
MKYICDWEYGAYRMYAELASRYYAFQDRIKLVPPSIVNQICGKPGQVEKLCPNAWGGGFSQSG